MTGTAMPSYAESGLDPGELWAIAGFVSKLAREGRQRKVAAWKDLFTRLGFHGGAAPGNAVHEAGNSAPFPEADGCLRCHQGIETINDRMQPALVAVAAGRPGAACAVCHAGNPDGATEVVAHEGLIGNPGSLWAVGLGFGCAQCHSGPGALTTFQGLALPSPVGGQLMNVVSKIDDPTGATGSGHAYRVPRGLMAAELGKATHTLAANGLIPKGREFFADVPVDDPDGPTPIAGSPAYRSWVDRAIIKGFLKPVERAEVIPGAAEGVALFGSLPAAAVGESYRKDCARCHLWDRGFPGAGGGYRSEGCAACHVLYGVDGLGHGRDPTHAGAGFGRPIEHRITAKIPSAQCAQCHWKGGGYYSDLHYQRGLECVDCHDSVDAHGDGNIYPTMHLQVSVACEDCHGTPFSYPWELPVGYGTPVRLPGARGVARVDGVDHLLTSRGNARSRWLRRGDQAILAGLDGRERPIPLLKDKQIHGSWASEGARVAMGALPGHLEKLECLACHVKKTVQCQGCHLEVDFRKEAIDWVATAGHRASPFDVATPIQTAGEATFRPSPHALVEPPLGVDLQGKVTGLVPGCLLTLRATSAKGVVGRLGPRLTSEGLPSATLAPLIPHAISLEARSCESCHTSPSALGYGLGNDRSSRAVDSVPGRHAPEAPGPHGSSMEYSGPSASMESNDRTTQLRGLMEARTAAAKGSLDVNRLVSRTDRQLKSLANPGERPLSRSERDLTEREGSCLACHRKAGTPGWVEIQRRLGRALTPEEHDRAISKILEAYLKPTQP